MPTRAEYVRDGGYLRGRPLACPGTRMVKFAPPPRKIRVRPLRSEPVRALTGETTVPGDKSISHRALMIGAIAVGETIVRGLLEGEDVLRTAGALRLLGVRVDRAANGAEWRIHGRGVGGLVEPDDILDLGNSGTGARLLMGLVSTHPFTTHFTGDASLRRRPMDRIAVPIQQMGAQVIAREGGRMPLVVVGAESPLPITYRLPVPSAQVKSAVLLAGLNAPGHTSVIESKPSRDHTELMLRHFGAQLEVVDSDAIRTITLHGEPELTACDVTVPGDPSSAAFVAVAALIAGESEVTIRNVGLNPLRAGIFQTLDEMGADITLSNRREQAGEPTADITVRSSALKGVTVPPERAPSMIDEYPILAVAAASATGETRLQGLEELRVKESDRLSAIADGLDRCGIRTAIENDDLIIQGTGRTIPGDAVIEARMDHRIAMSFLVMGMAAQRPIAIDDVTHIGTSFPGFEAKMTELGATFSVPDGA